MSDAIFQAGLSAVRTILISVGTTLLVAKGLVTEDALQQIVGGFMARAAGLWGAYAGYKKEKL